MTLLFVRRNAQGLIDAAFANPQPGYATEAVSDDVAELVAYLNPAPVPIPPSPRAWLERLSADKQAAIAAAGVGNGTILLWLLKAAGSPSIDVTLPETIAGVGALVAAGILTTADQATLLTP